MAYQARLRYTFFKKKIPASSHTLKDTHNSIFHVRDLVPAQ